MTFVDLKSVTVYRQNIVNIIAPKLLSSHESNDIIQIQTFITFLTRKSFDSLKRYYQLPLVFLLDYRARSEKRAMNGRSRAANLETDL